MERSQRVQVRRCDGNAEGLSASSPLYRSVRRAVEGLCTAQSFKSPRELKAYRATREPAVVQRPKLKTVEADR